MSESFVRADAESVSTGVALFLDRMQDDPVLGATFEGVDRDRVERHALAFVIAALGGPDLYLGRDLRAVHEPLRLNDANYDTAVEYLVESLRDVGIADGVLADLAIRLEPLRRQIVAS